MDLTKNQQQVIDLVKEMSAVELNGLVKALEEEFGVTAAAMVVAGGAAGGAAADAGAAGGSDSVNVELTEAGQQKIAVIKVVKEVLGIDLKAAKDLVEAAPKVIKENVNALKINNDEYRILNEKDFQALDRFKNENKQFDLVILDPPYEEGKYEEVVNRLYNDDLLSNNAIIVMEANRNITLENIDYQKNKEYHYGEIMVFIYWR